MIRERKIIIITGKWCPNECGVTDYCLSLAMDIQKSGFHVKILSICDNSKKFLEVSLHDNTQIEISIVNFVSHLSSSNVILFQYTPYLYSERNLMARFRIIKFLMTLRDKVKIISIFHEGYKSSPRKILHVFLALLHCVEVYLISYLSTHVLSSSQPLVAELKKFFGSLKVFWCPISSNLRVSSIDPNFHVRKVPVTAGGELVLGLFGGGNNLRGCFDHILILQKVLNENNIRFSWHVFGNVGGDLCAALSPSVIHPNLSQVELSAKLQLVDILIMPHLGGVSLKRGTLMAAMQHSLTVVGTQALHTDDMLKNCDGVFLFPLSDVRGFCQKVLFLAKKPAELEISGKNNLYDYREKFSRKARISIIKNLF